MGWGKLPLQNQGEIHYSGGPPGSRFNPFVAEPKPPALAGSLSPACEEVPIFVPRAAAVTAAKSLQSCPTLCDPIDAAH